ncbi:hypothetical protein SELMODRAFT_423842 [Selaginella moellendorffii]|uniref:Secreted protein n=1 Tax=Selaginella moellendorffii TaxID=88036 RepID=D8SN13_SELML|nr:hypothetical protein SELMODRAFT_423842 [Selaginella moellendorffii]
MPLLPWSLEIFVSRCLIVLAARAAAAAAAASDRSGSCSTASTCPSRDSCFSAPGSLSRLLWHERHLTAYMESSGPSESRRTVCGLCSNFFTTCARTLARLRVEEDLQDQLLAERQEAAVRDSQGWGRLCRQDSMKTLRGTMTAESELSDFVHLLVLLFWTGYSGKDVHRATIMKATTGSKGSSGAWLVRCEEETVFFR